MANATSASAPEAHQPAFRVESPRVGDAIGRALRDVYSREPGLPDDMAAMLRQLNGSDNRSSC